MEQINNNQTIRFNFFRLKFTPYKEIIHKENSKSIIKAVFSYLNRELQIGRGYLVNKNANRKNEEERELFMTLAFTELKKDRIRGTIALLRSGRLPYIKPQAKFNLIPIDKSQGDIAEQTHFFIDYSKDDCIVCVEFNNNGPRMSDIEFYLRKLASEELGLARATTVVTLMNSSLDDAISKLVNVLNIDIKVQPPKLNLLELDLQGYFTTLKRFADTVNPKFLKVEAMFQLPGGKVIKSKEENKDANKMIKTLLNRFKSKPENIDSFENFVVKYEDKEGNEDVFNLLKGKKEINKEIDLSTLKTAKDWYSLIESDFDDLMSTI